MNPLEPEAAQRIVGEYAAVLEDHSVREVYPSPTSTLPYPKDVIKTAIGTCVRSLTATGQMTDELRDFLEVSYISLADFVEDELVRLMTEFRAAGADLERGSPLVKERIATPAWQVLSGSGRIAGEIAGTIARETELLRSEFRALK